jgi:hypothetical protein
LCAASLRDWRFFDVALDVMLICKDVQTSLAACVIMKPMQARRGTFHSPRSSRLIWGRLALWLATLLFLIQVPLHISTPAGMSMAEHLATLLNVSGLTASGPAMTDMHTNDPAVDQGAVDQGAVDHLPASSNHTPGQSPPGHSSSGHHAQGLCCMSPLALVPLPWTPPLSPPELRPLPPPKAASERLKMLRAMARGPPVLGAVSIAATVLFI